jgi:WD40 repeat protein/energy-coupling factor transporter ATP-binding protein EcfA2
MGPKRDNKDFNPFPGLRPFAPEESDLFFGREAESEEILGKIVKNRYVTVIGAPGSGKSSLINCGVLPKIRNFKIGESSEWKIIPFSSGNDPFGNLATALSKEILDSEQKYIERNIILSELLDNPDGFSSVIRKYLIKSENNVLLVIDQFEEIFRYAPFVKEEAFHAPVAKFVDFLVNTVNQSSVNIFIIVTMRSDYIGECSHYKGLTKLVNDSNWLVPDMGKENYRKAIEGPINYCGAKIDPELVDILLNEVVDRTDLLPVLQHVMMRTWTQWRQLDEPDKPISITDYDYAGTMSNAISIHADKVYKELNQRGKEICEIMFKTITRKSRDNKSLRHPSDIETIKSVAGCTSEELIDVVEKFRSPSVSFITPRQNIPLSEDSVIDLSHEVLIRFWDRLRDWVDNEASSMQMYLRLSEASALYQQGKTSLWRPTDLNSAITWRDQLKPTLAWAVQYNPAFERAMVFLRTSEKVYLEEEGNKIRQQKGKMKKTRLLVIILGLTAVMAMGFMLFAFIQKKSAEKQTMLVEKQRIHAEKEKAMADSSTFIALKQRTIADSAAALAIHKAAEANQQRIVAEMQKSFAERIAAEAQRQKKVAVEQSDSVKGASIRSDQNTKVAIEQRNSAQRLRMLSIGKSMSLKSLQLLGQKDLQSLLAYQAYLFNKKNNGPDNDADIYAGLYNVALQYGNINCRSFKGHNGEIKSIAFVPGKNEFFTSGNDGQVLKWSLDSKDQTLQVIYSGSDIIEVLAVSPDASWLACGSANASIRMIPLKGTNVGYEMTGHKGGIKSLIFSYDGKYLYSAALDGKVLKWDIAARTSTNVTTGSMEITSIDISSNGNYLAGISTDGNVVVWNPEHNPDNFRIETAGKNIKVIKFNPENNLLAIGDANGVVELWDINLRKKISGVKAHDAQVNDIQFNTTLKQMATAGNDKKLKIFDIKDPADLTEPPVTLDDNEGFVLVMQFSPDGQMIVSGESGGSKNLVSRPSHVDYLVRNICNIISRNMTQEEWNNYVAKDIPLEKTCQDKSLNIKIDQIKSASK